MNLQLEHGDSLTVLQRFADNSIDSIVTDPPYGLSFMGRKWDYQVPSIELWTEILRVLKPGGYAVAFCGTRTYHRLVVNMEDAGFEIRDQLQWIYGSGFPKSHNLGKAYDAKIKTGKSSPKAMREAAMGDDYKPTPGAGTPDYGNKGNHFGNGSEIYEHKLDNKFEGWGTALKPANEPIVLARKPISEKTVIANAIKWGTGGINIDASRVGDEQRTYDLTMTSGNFETTGGGKNTKSGQATVEGRFPANVIHDGSDEVLAGFPNVKSTGGVYKKDGNRDDTSYGVPNKKGADCSKYAGQTGSAARYFYCAKVSKKERNFGLDVEETPNKRPIGTAFNNEGGIHTDDRIKKGNTHPTVKPVALMAYLCKLITPVGGTILDPFNGSGSTGMAAIQEGFSYVGIDLDEEHIKVSDARIRAWNKEYNN